MGKTQRIFSKKGKKTQVRRKTNGKKPIRRKSVRRGKKTGGLQGAAESIEGVVNEISKLIVKGSIIENPTESTEYKEAIGKLIYLTKSGKASCRLNKLWFGHKICELNKTNSYGKAIILYNIIQQIKELKPVLEHWITDIDASMNIKLLEEALYNKTNRGEIKNDTLIEHLKSNQKKYYDDYDANLLEATAKPKSEWENLLSIKIRMYQFIIKNPEHYLATIPENPELGLERVILDAQESKEEQELLSETFTFTKFPIRTFLLQYPRGLRSVESYKRRQRELYIEAIEYFTEESKDENLKNLANSARDEVIKKKEEEKELTEEQFKKEVTELLSWEKTDEGKKEKTEFIRRFEKIKSEDWKVEIKRQEEASKN